jgi:hypothetical protein
MIGEAIGILAERENFSIACNHTFIFLGTPKLLMGLLSNFALRQMTSLLLPDTTSNYGHFTTLVLLTYESMAISP